MSNDHVAASKITTPANSKKSGPSKTNFTGVLNSSEANPIVSRNLNNTKRNRKPNYPDNRQHNKRQSPND